MPIGSAGGLPFFSPEPAGADEELQLRREQLDFQRGQQRTLGEIQRQNVLAKKVDQVGDFIKLRQPEAAQRLIDAEPELSRTLGQLKIDEQGGRFRIVTKKGVTIVEGPDGEWKTISQPKPERPSKASLALEASGGDPGRALGLLQKPEREKVSVGDLQGQVLNKFLQKGRAGLSANEQAVADRLLLDPDIGLALKLLDKDYTFAPRPATEKARIIAETVRNLKEGRTGEPAAPTPEPTAVPARRSFLGGLLGGSSTAEPTPTARPTKQEAVEQLRRRGYTEEELREYGLLE